MLRRSRARQGSLSRVFFSIAVQLALSVVTHNAGHAFIAPNTYAPPPPATATCLCPLRSRRPRQASECPEEENDAATSLTNRARVWYVDAASDPHRRGISETPRIRFVPQKDVSTTNYRKAAEQTWNWCANFVTRYHLCPWALQSVQARDAIQIYCVPQSYDELDIREVLEQIACRFTDDLQKERTDPNTAISFLIFVRPTKSVQRMTHHDQQHWINDFSSFHDWFFDLEENWALADTVTLAPFHPDWSYDASDSALAMEKHSPFPTISLVSTAIIDKAGESASRQIASNNEQVLLQRSLEDWKRIYAASVLDVDEPNSRENMNDIR
jgi:hypothetical protein